MSKEEDKKKEGKNSKDIPKKTVHTEDSKEDDRKKKRKILNPADQDFLESEKICIQNEPAQKKEKKILKEKSNTLKIRSSSRTSDRKKHDDQERAVEKLCAAEQSSQRINSSSTLQRTTRSKSKSSSSSVQPAKVSNDDDEVLRSSKSSSRLHKTDVSKGAITREHQSRKKPIIQQRSAAAKKEYPDDAIKEPKNKSETRPVTEKVGTIVNNYSAFRDQSDSPIRVVKKLEHGLVLFGMEPLAGKEFHLNNWAVEIDYETQPYFTVKLVRHADCSPIPPIDKESQDVHQSSNKEDNFIENPNGILDEIASLSSHKSKPDLTTIIENLKMKAQLRENSKIGDIALDGTVKGKSDVAHHLTV